mmetsp:Transcript_18519/g.29386  ORF Transcript_18519/g.29386 Transcript_18519/m.29386 type:complete len:243 (+) Transcript_18519:55-783(+)|eukprot:CAMPEP_0202696736 /NCGR_PEP_ID=MMETSP1385-20130828/10059_1 /ASSEMBLY_ACC=CAM_ASM_000861 /TAXON_ID=933848 /ORGANISM="Elphidium margaritaceum" /LENGTH=242 /DNA_ID=CAMNT_0049352997 /DNA_START=48 /DNA_END=776 /DNA_ORIENTATION=-
MSDSKDAQKRINQMIKFIEQEAREKADEIRMKADEEFQIEKGRILNPERIKLNKDFDRKFKDLEIKRKIELSTQINKARLQVLEKRGELMKKVDNDTYKRLSSLKKDQNEYKQLLKKLMIQGFIRIDETTVTVRVVKEDVALAQSICKEAANEYKSIWRKQVGMNDDLKATLDTTRFLPPSAVGGVSIYARQDRICCDNTLQARLTVCQQALMPILRGKLFGVVAHRGIVYDDADQTDKHDK